MSSAVTPDLSWEGVLSKVRTFPSLPMIVHKITELVNTPETSAKDIEAVIAKDQVLTANCFDSSIPRSMASRKKSRRFPGPSASSVSKPSET